MDFLLHLLCTDLALYSFPGGEKVFLPATDVFLAASQKQESTSREERLSLPQEKSTKPSLYTADAKESPSATSSQHHMEF